MTFSGSCYTKRSIVPLEPRMPQFGDEGIQQELMLPSQSITVLHFLRIAELAKERVEYAQSLFDRHRFFYREVAYDIHLFRQVESRVLLRQCFRQFHEVMTPRAVRLCEIHSSIQFFSSLGLNTVLPFEMGAALRYISSAWCPSVAAGNNRKGSPVSKSVLEPGGTGGREPGDRRDVF
jgi:hypothetical protein